MDEWDECKGLLTPQVASYTSSAWLRDMTGQSKKALSGPGTMFLFELLEPRPMMMGWPGRRVRWRMMGSLAAEPRHSSLILMESDMA